MLDKDTKCSPWRLLFLLLLLLILALLLAFCSNDRFRHTVCDGICATSPDKKVILLMNKTKVGSKYLDTPYSKLLFKDDSGGSDELMSPRDAKWGTFNSEEYVKMKTQGLDPDCFSETEYFPPNLDYETLTPAEMVIRVLDFGEDGNLESYDLNIDPFNDSHSQSNNISNFDYDLLPLGKVPNTQGNYKSIKYYISQLTTAELKHSGSTVSHREMPSDTPMDKTPFHKGFKKSYAGTNGFVYFYVLADEGIKFNEDMPAFYAHIPEAIQTLYSPYFQEEVEDKKADTPHILVLHFYRHTAMVQDVTPDPDTKDINCRYPYDIAVIADGQDGIHNIKVETPLLIDPDTGTKGSFP